MSLIRKESLTEPVWEAPWDCSCCIYLCECVQEAWVFS